ncbi:unnamed protein product [Caenorhabditis angaria]|uniref:EB domain-containing protein n=1 Tax=Caenorhabditis angaria TaxID=860376 RepID=A0A9P1IFS7_9PELO|nr:unnamed protein product [Caenorhabditis angaria]
MWIFLAISIFSAPILGYSIGGGVTENQGTYNYNNGGNNGIGGGVQPSSTKTLGSYCSSSSDCQSGLTCQASVNGVKICLGSQSYPNSNPTSGCSSNSDCQAGSSCVISGSGSRNCQINVGGYVRPTTTMARQDPPKILDPAPGDLNSPCERDSDCNTALFCTLYFGEMICRHQIKALIPLRCESEADCPPPSGEYLCVFSTAVQDRICYKYGDTVTDGYVIPIKHRLALTSTVPPAVHVEVVKESKAVFEEPEESRAIFEDSGSVAKRHDTSIPREPIYIKVDDADLVKMSLSNDAPPLHQDVFVEEPMDPAAVPCDKDYHCRMGESCSGRIRFVDRNVTVCRYDMTKKGRQCIYHSDCLSGQRCKVQNKDDAICITDIQATIGNIECFYDYQCSGGEKCTQVEGEKFLCRVPVTQDPRMNQMCSSNAECPFQQVCRHSSGISMCIDVSIAKNPSLIHQHFLQFFRSVFI